MKNLSIAVRTKAIEIGNALLKEGMEEGRALAIAIGKAEDWVESRRRLRRLGSA